MYFVRCLNQKLLLKVKVWIMGGKWSYLNNLVDDYKIPGINSMVGFLHYDLGERVILFSFKKLGTLWYARVFFIFVPNEIVNTEMSTCKCTGLRALTFQQGDLKHYQLSSNLKNMSSYLKVLVHWKFLAKIFVLILKRLTL